VKLCCPKILPVLWAFDQVIIICKDITHRNIKTGAETKVIVLSVGSHLVVAADLLTSASSVCTGRLPSP